MAETGSHPQKQLLSTLIIFMLLPIQVLLVSRSRCVKSCKRWRTSNYSLVHSEAVETDLQAGIPYNVRLIHHVFPEEDRSIRRSLGIDFQPKIVYCRTMGFCSYWMPCVFPVGEFHKLGYCRTANVSRGYSARLLDECQTGDLGSRTAWAEFLTPEEVVFCFRRLMWRLASRHTAESSSALYALGLQQVARYHQQGMFEVVRAPAY
jgi:hypothetical protein